MWQMADEGGRPCVEASGFIQRQDLTGEACTILALYLGPLSPPVRSLFRLIDLGRS